MKKIVFSFFVGFVFIPSMVFGVIYWLNRGGFFNLENVEVTIENANPAANFMRPLADHLKERLHQYQGQSLWDLDLKKISEEMSEQDWIESNYLSRRWPSTLHIQVHAKDVQLLYMSSTGQLIPIVKDGSFLRPVPSSRSPDVSVLAGDVFEKNIEMRKKAVKVISEIPAEGAFSQKSISELRYDSKEGFWATLIQTGMKVKMGEENISMKAERVSQVIEYMESRQLEARVIDANLSKKVLVRLRKGP